MVILLMGVAGAGKSTIGKALAVQLGARFIDADDLHPPANVEKMRRGEPLNDDDRVPWLEAVRQQLRGNVVLACSALKAQYRRTLNPTHVVFLEVPREALERRLRARTGHFFSAALLQSQLDALEVPTDAITVDATKSVDDVVDEILRRSFHSTPG
jgi:gluconokinase